MNPPPYRGPEEGKNRLVRQVLLASLIALPVVALIVFVVAPAVVAQRKSMQAKAAWRDMEASANQAQSDLKKNFDPKTGITNADFTDSDKLREKLKDASQKLSGDDAVVARVGAEYLEQTQDAAKNYQTAAAKLREAHVLGQFDSSNPAQIATRREIVRDFIAANTTLKEVVMSSEDKVRAELVAAKIRDSKIDAYMRGFHSSAGPKNTLIVKIRQCDDRVGNAMLDILNTLETHRDRWETDLKADKIRFKDHADLATYNSDLAIIKTAGEEQLRLQTMLVNLPSSPPTSNP
jgi:hypothetical protein